MGANTQQYGRLEKKKGLTRVTNIYRDIFLHAWDTAGDERQNPSPRGPRGPWEEGRQHGVRPHTCARPSDPELLLPKRPVPPPVRPQRRGHSGRSRPPPAERLANGSPHFQTRSSCFRNHEGPPRRAEGHVRTERTKPNHAVCWSSDRHKARKSH